MIDWQTRNDGQDGRPVPFIAALAIAAVVSTLLWLIIVALGYVICRWWWI